ncbi:hypothetical protein K450DRAFT_238315 [Umbelopsis ramanniana AG]|uniref:Uncharacterized protein n=1 Tax=Umbelopsis ramanniana AG TaxID=1314678 RepID=A0AAD5EA23_UMBRA|nr:uncharacterized protein K450DRAFT_238315 [Umbelopsis ramanniana AG]KAI8580131.1 hypothetical protein K450DRAFT_238315 [Umbelopsis ramanniana AG]
MKLAISLVLTVSLSFVLGLDIWDQNGFQGQRTNVATVKNRCVRLDHQVNGPIASVRAETCDVQCYGFTDVWCEEQWNRIDCQGYAYVGSGTLKSVRCL